MRQCFSLARLADHQAQSSISLLPQCWDSNPSTTLGFFLMVLLGIGCRSGAGSAEDFLFQPWGFLFTSQVTWCTSSLSICKRYMWVLPTVVSSSFLKSFPWNWYMWGSSHEWPQVSVEEPFPLPRLGLFRKSNLWGHSLCFTYGWHQVDSLQKGAG